MDALSCIATSADFQIPTPQAATALDFALSLLRWAAEGQANRACMLEFEATLLMELERCITASTNTRKTHSGRTTKALNMHSYWECYHKLTCSLDLRSRWATFFGYLCWHPSLCSAAAVCYAVYGGTSCYCSSLLKSCTKFLHIKFTIFALFALPISYLQVQQPKNITLECSQDPSSREATRACSSQQ
jgi:hypothetical protein